MGLKDKLKAAGVKITPVKWVLRPEILLCPNVPKPMHGVAPRVVLGAKWWNQTRQTAYRSTAYHCVACGVWKHDAKGRQWIEGHELYDIDYKRGRMVYVETVPLCNYCHQYIHDGRLLNLLEQGKITHAKYAAIIQHGDAVLRKAGLKKPSRRERDDKIERLMLRNEVAAWGKWRLILFGNKYPPKFKTFEQWIEGMKNASQENTSQD